MSELMIKNGLVYTYIYEGYHAIKLRFADIHIKDGLIADVSPDLDRACDTLDASGCLVLPGMVNMGASTFAARIMSGLACDWRRGKGRIAPMLDLAVEMLTEGEAAAIATLGLWETLSGGATTIVELCRADGGDGVSPLSYRALPEALSRSVIKAGEDLGANVLLTDGGETAGLTDSAVSCADFGLSYAGLEGIKAGAKLVMGTGATSSCMIEEMRAAARAVKLDAGDPIAYRASDVFYSATVVGGRELDKDRHGRLGPGFRGDVSVVDMNRFKPLSYPLSQYVYGASAADVRHVVCGGVVVKRDHTPEKRLHGLLADASETAEAAISRLWAEARRVIL